MRSSSADARGFRLVARAAGGVDPRRRALAAALLPAGRARGPRARRARTARARRAFRTASPPRTSSARRPPGRAGGLARRTHLVARRLSPGTLSGVEILERIEEHVRRHDLIEPGGEVLCLVSGGADSTCLWHALRELGYRVSALHVNHGLRGERVRRGRALLRRALRCRGRPVDAPRRDRGRAARRSATRSRRPAARDRAHRLRPGRDDLYRLAAEGRTQGDQAAARGRRRAAAAPRLARGDRGVLPRARGSSSAPTRRTRTRCAA